MNWIGLRWVPLIVATLLGNGSLSAGSLHAVTRRTSMSGVPTGGAGAAATVGGVTPSVQAQAAAAMLLPGQTPLAIQSPTVPRQPAGRSATTGLRPAPTGPLLPRR